MKNEEKENFKKKKIFLRTQKKINFEKSLRIFLILN